MTDDAVGSIIKSPKAQQSALLAVLLAVGGWAHARIFALEQDVATAKAAAASASSRIDAQEKADERERDDRLAMLSELRTATADNRAATANVEKQMARLETVLELGFRRRR